MWNKPTQQRLDRIPALYATEDIDLKDKMVYLHFFIGACDWYAIEYDGKDLFFGFAIINNDLQNAEFGYFSLAELTTLNSNLTIIHKDGSKHSSGQNIQVDCEHATNFKPRPARQITKIARAQNWKENWTLYCIRCKDIVTSPTEWQHLSPEDFNYMASGFTCQSCEEEAYNNGPPTPHAIADDPGPPFEL